MGIPVVANTNDPYSAALSSPNQPHEKRRPAPPVIIERSGVSKWLAMAIGAAVLFVVAGLGILLAVLLSDPHAKDGKTAESAKHQKAAGTSSTPRRGGEKKERTFKPTAEQQEAAKRGVTGTDGGRAARNDFHRGRRRTISFRHHQFHRGHGWRWRLAPESCQL